MTGGMFVDDTNRAACWPDPLKCWWLALSGIANSEPVCHSKVTSAPASFQTRVEPCPSRTRIISSNSCRWGASLPPAGISQT
jgi:hypothetical protein